MANAILDNIKTRRSIRSFTSTPVPQSDLDQIIEAGLFAASAKGLQNTIIIQVTNKELRDKISKINCEIGGWENRDPFYNAPAILIVLAKKDYPHGVYDGSLVLGNMMLAAHSLDLGSIWIHRAKEEFEQEFGKNLLAELGIDGEFEGIGHLAVGYISGDYPTAAPRKAGRVYKVE